MGLSSRIAFVKRKRAISGRPQGPYTVKKRNPDAIPLWEYEKGENRCGPSVRWPFLLRHRVKPDDRHCDARKKAYAYWSHKRNLRRHRPGAEPLLPGSLREYDRCRPGYYRYRHAGFQCCSAHLPVQPNESHDQMGFPERACWCDLDPLNHISQIGRCRKPQVVWVASSLGLHHNNRSDYRVRQPLLPQPVAVLRHEIQ